MQLGMIGLGRMGANMVRRLMRGGHECVVYDRFEQAVNQLAGEGAVAAFTLEEFAGKLQPPRVVWLMLPAAAVDASLEELKPLLRAGDMVIDGGNSHYSDDIRRAEQLAELGIRYMDVGTSGGVWGLREGYSLMIGGADDAVSALRPLFEALAPAPDRGWAHVGPAGAGHFVKMVHNGIEYGMMQAYAEGFTLMHRKTELDLDLAAIAEIWRHGSVVRSWLLDLTAEVLGADTELRDVAPWVADSGEGRWTVTEAIDLDVPAPVITLALIQRLRSRDEEAYGDRLLAAMRRAFGGHAVRESAPPPEPGG
jgi:6-phosphogluconate dehydrogenase